MRSVRFIGDVHGKYRRYRDLIRGIPRSIQVGDMGVGFSYWFHDELYFRANPPFQSMSRGDHKFIRGNHDNPAVCRNQRFWIPDGTYYPDDEMFCVGGATSIDIAHRSLNQSWWEDEELSIGQFYEITDRYLEVKPKIMVSHECPTDISPYMLNPTKEQYPSTTRQAFNIMWAQHQPKLWVFGHYHREFDRVFDGTRFVCIPELGVLDIDLDTV